MALGPHVFAKVPNSAAAFLLLAEPMVDEFSLTAVGILALAVVVAILLSAVRWRASGSLVALLLFLAPTLPTLFVPYMPQRYLTIPYAGFVLLIAVWLGALGRRWPQRRWAIRAGGGVTAILVIAIGAANVRADLEDYRRIADAHERLLIEAAAVAEVVRRGEPVLVVRDERISPLHEIVTSPVGLPKLAFIRNSDPYGLIDTAALFEWVLAEDRIGVDHLPSAGSAGESESSAVLVHRAGGFVDLGVVEDGAAESDRWRESGRAVQRIRTVPLGR
jgi:hypothetical protein